MEENKVTYIVEPDSFTEQCVLCNRYCQMIESDYSNKWNGYVCMDCRNIYDMEED